MTAAVCYLAAYLIAGHTVILHAVRNCFHGAFFDEEFLMTVASLGAIAIGEYPEAAALMLLYHIGERLEDSAVAASHSSIQSLLAIRPDRASVKRAGTIITVNPDDVAVGEIIVVKPGERISNDGIITTGTTFIDTSALTGESVPRAVIPGTQVMAGSINTQNVIEITVTHRAEDSTAAKIIRLTEAAAQKKAHMERFITRFSRRYTPAVCAAAVLVAVIPPLLTGGEWKLWLYRALTFLVISCPCAFVISVPLTFFSGIGVASRAGILIKSGRSLETLSRAVTAVFDKTGTITNGTFTITAIHPADDTLIPADALLAIATHAERFSSHPISASLKAAHSGSCCALAQVTDAEEIAGKGIRVTLDGKTVVAGTLAFMAENRVSGYLPCAEDDFGTIIHIAIDGTYAGHIVISDIIKAGTAETMHALKQLGVKELIMLTGDERAPAVAVAQKIGIDTVRAELLPADKVAAVETALATLGAADSTTRGTLLFAGDGINDAPVLSRADVGIAMGALGSDAAIEAADVVVMTDELPKIAEAIRIAQATMRIARQNVVCAFTVKLVIMILGALGITSMWMAVFGDTGIALLAVLNAMRLQFRKGRRRFPANRNTAQAL
ncbi:MAG: cadmium-translocating P-type ATPase [Treponema sp.]|nr:cadmium-translocating P-type ATPase [Treponema sp.]